MEIIKRWILSRGFVKEEVNSSMDKFISLREETYRKAFDDARKDLEETLLYDTDKKAEDLSRKKLNEMLSPVDLSSIVTLDKSHGIVYVGGVRADDLQLQNLKQEAEALKQFSIWKLLHETPKELAQRSMFVDSQSLDDVKKGKSILYTLSVQNNILNTVLSYIPKK